MDEAALVVVCAVIIRQNNHHPQGGRFMRSVVRIDKQGKVRPLRRRALRYLPSLEEREGLVSVFQALIPLGLHAVDEVLEAEVTALAGPRYSRIGGQPGYARWGRSRARSVCSIRNCRFRSRGCAISGETTRYRSRVPIVTEAPAARGAETMPRLGIARPRSSLRRWVHPEGVATMPCFLTVAVNCPLT
jgi:hypothetical protein